MPGTHDTISFPSNKSALEISLKRLEYWYVIAMLSEHRGDADRLGKILDERRKQDPTPVRATTTADRTIAKTLPSARKSQLKLPTAEAARRMPLKRLEYWYLIALFSDRKIEAKRLMKILSDRRASQD